MTDAELIKAAAERVMGWEIISQRHFCRTGGIAGEDAVEMSGDIYPLVRENPAPSVWNPLTSDNDCWQLVDKLKDRERHLVIEYDAGHRHAIAQWAVTFGLHGMVADPDRRRAIVLAALKACGMEA